jgi:hypothetical protein
LPALPALVRIATAFPPLVDDIVGFLVQLGRICLSQSCLNGSYDYRIVSSMKQQIDGLEPDEDQCDDQSMEQDESPAEQPMEQEVKKEVKREAEEGEIEEGELPETKTTNGNSTINGATIASRRPRPARTYHMTKANSTELRELFKILPETSIMGAEVYRTFSLLCEQAILHERVY